MAKTDDRLFAPFPIEMDEHPKIAPLSDAAFRALFEATFYSRRMLSDGFLDERIVLKRWGRDVADELSSNDPERPSWVRVDGPKPGWQIHDFEKHHPLRADIEALKTSRSEAGKRGGRKSAETRWGSKTEATGKQTVSKSNPETETETETSKEQNPLSDANASNRGELIPNDWRPNQTHIDKAASLHLDVKREYQRFRQSAETKHRRLKNWNTGFTNWLRKQAEFNQQRQGVAPVTSKPTPTDRAATTIALGRSLDQLEIQ